MADRQEQMQELAAQGRALRTHIPEVYNGYFAMSRAVMSEGALPRKVKELVALAIAVTRECDGCIDAHAGACARAGVTEEEVAEAMGVAILMNGGPGTVWGPRALAAFKDLSAAGS